MKSATCRWGILGTANIARKNWQAIRCAPNCTLTAVASRQAERSQQFVAECQSHAPFPQPPRSLGSYEELLLSDDVDAIYLPLPTAIRKPWAIAAANAGKHILVEKPVGVIESDVQEILAACQANRVQFMDGVMFMHNERLQQLRHVLDDETNIGSVQRITSEFTFGAPPQFFAENIRATSSLEPLGCLGDLGWYNIRFALWVMRWQMPLRVRGQMLAARQRPDSPQPVPVDFAAELVFPNASAAFYCSFITQIQQWASIAGPAGSIHISDFVLPWHGSELAWELSQPVFYLRGCDFHMERHVRRTAVREHSNSDPSAQESRMFTTFAHLVQSGQPDPVWGEMALKTQRVSDACLASAQRDGQWVDVGD